MYTVSKKKIGNSIRAVRHNIKFISLLIMLHHNKYQPIVYVSDPVTGPVWPRGWVEI